MIRSSPSMKAGVVAVSVVAHGAVAYAFFSEPEIEIAGGADVSVNARLGNSFEDLAAGAVQADVSETEEVEPVELEAVEPPVEAVEAPPKAIRPREVEPAERARPVETAEQAAPQVRIKAARPESNAVPVLPLEAVTPETALPSPVAEVVRNEEATEVTETQPDEMAALLPKLEPAPLAAVPSPPETLVPIEEQAVEASPRPPERPKRETREVLRETSQGNSNRNATAGSTTGSRAATSTRQSTNSGQSAASGNAAVSNYPGQVMRRISRVRSPRVGSRGTATIRFSISANGGLASASVVRSSGSARLDKAALQVIRKAAPFPKPPPGAKRNFSIQIQGRG